MKHIVLHAMDAFSDKDDATNPIYILPQNIIQFERYSGPFHLQAYAPDGRPMPTGKFKQVLCGSLVMLAVGGARIVAENPEQIVEILSGTFE